MSTERPAREDSFARILASTSQNRKINNTIASSTRVLVSIDSWLFLVETILLGSGDNQAFVAAYFPRISSRPTLSGISSRPSEGPGLDDQGLLKQKTLKVMPR